MLNGGTVLLAESEEFEAQYLHKKSKWLVVTKTTVLREARRGCSLGSIVV